MAHSGRPVAEAAPAPGATAPAAIAQAAPAPGASAPAATAQAASAPSAASETPAQPQQRMALVVNPATGAVAEPSRAAAPVAAAPAGTRVAAGALGEFERVLASAGVDVRRMFSELDSTRNQGGPFVPLPRGMQIPTLSPEKLAALRTIVKAVPVGAPLSDYEISSPFGPRGDPEDGRGEFHTGVDMTAPYDSPVYATAPGVVTFAGYRDDYGKIVEIDHGNGLATRYAHLNRYTVSVGQRVPAHAQIGYLGSTGHATGPHVHYEVLVNGEPQNPEKFVDLARFMPAIIQTAAHR
jgi:murein DD-endopeptidase MepM/ murein hydrolase activator NlpD